MASMNDRFASFREATASALLRGPGATPAELRDAIARGAPPAELAQLVNKIDSGAYMVSGQDVDMLRKSYTDDQLFEIIVAAAYGAAEKRLMRARRVLEEA